MNKNKVIKEIVSIIGGKNVITSKRHTEPYRTAYRYGKGDAFAVVKPKSLLEFWKILNICNKYKIIILIQAANTGLTDGSSPYGKYDRDLIIINTLKINKIFKINDAKQVVALPGATLYGLEKLLKPFKRKPHSEIGSSCIGASVIGGVCNNSGGALVHRGPAYTELSIYAQINDKGELNLINNIGINLGNNPEDILNRLDAGNFSEKQINVSDKKASAEDYIEIVKDINANSPARYNADKRMLYEASGCAGKIAVFAVRLDTFEEVKDEKVFYIGTNKPEELTLLRKRLLTESSEIPILTEYMHKTLFNITEKYGKDVFLLINYLGTNFMPFFFLLKGRFDAFIKRIRFVPDNLSDRILQSISRVFPSHIPKAFLKYRDRYEHYLIVKCSGSSLLSIEKILAKVFNNNTEHFMVCNKKDAKKILLHRFAAAGAAVRYTSLNSTKVEGLLSLDVALKRNDRNFCEKLPEHIIKHIDMSLICAHFLCHVFHQDYIIKKGSDINKIKDELLKILDEKGAEYPAEHNVGHSYKAKEPLVSFYKKLDPTNSFNPGIGKTSKKVAKVY